MPESLGLHMQGKQHQGHTPVSTIIEPQMNPDLFGCESGNEIRFLQGTRESPPGLSQGHHARQNASLTLHAPKPWGLRGPLKNMVVRVLLLDNVSEI